MKTIYLYLVNDVVYGWSENRSMEEEVEVQLDESHPLFSSRPRMFVYKDGEVFKSSDLELQDAKQKKDLELNRACRESILAGFYHVIDGVQYWFSYDKEAQQNFTDAQAVFADGLVQELKWTVKKDGEYTRIVINNDIMNELKLVILNHKDSNISKYRDILMPLLNSATTVEEVEAITWD